MVFSLVSYDGMQTNHLHRLGTHVLLELLLKYITFLAVVGVDGYVDAFVVVGMLY